MRILIDTNAYAELARGNTHIRGLLQSSDEIIVSTIVLGELYAGFKLGTRSSANMGELDEFLHIPGVTIYPPDKAVTERYGEVIRILKENGTPIPTNDAWIAATALETGSRVVSFDSHFSLVPGIMSLL